VIEVTDMILEASDLCAPSGTSDLRLEPMTDAGTVLLERSPDAAEERTDGALACLIVADALRGHGIGTRAIAVAATALVQQGCKRVIAEWVASVPLYQRLGFTVWKQRTIEPA
jgi:GNAT superfamily N-acetyltransferase